MMTRSAQLKKRATINETPLNSDIESLDDKIDVQDHLAQAQEGVEILLKQVKSLRERNETLTAELQDLRDAANPSNRSSNEDLQEQVRMLKRNIRKLEKTQQKDKEKIQKYQADEIKHEAADLEDPADNDVGETTHTMRKLLRRFSDLMSMNVLDKDEECVVCLETMTLKQCSSLPCQHLICNTCLPQICKVDWSIRSTDSEGEQGEEVTKCPLCREQTPRRDVELVHYTATGQWDALLEIVKEWVEMDRRRADETTDEEEEEDFIREASTNASSSASSESPNVSRGSTPESDLVVDRAVTPPQEAMRSQSNTARCYLTSPSATKRKRMEELAKQRTKKKRL